MMLSITLCLSQIIVKVNINRYNYKLWTKDTLFTSTAKPARIKDLVSWVNFTWS
jgi:hypothetical protein